MIYDAYCMEDKMGRACGIMRKRFWWGNLEEREMTEHLGIDRRMILKWILKKSNRRAWTV